MAFSVAYRRPCRALLLPNSGNSDGQAKPNRLIVPGSRPTPSPFAKPLVPTEPQDAQGKRTYRPPMGYFVQTKDRDAAAVDETDEEAMIQRLNAGAGRWYELAAYIPRLNVAGYDAYLIEQLAGIAKREQDILVTAASVRQSIARHSRQQNLAGYETTMEYFEIEGRTLLALRMLRIRQGRISLCTSCGFST